MCRVLCCSLFSDLYPLVFESGVTCSSVFSKIPAGISGNLDYADVLQSSAEPVRFSGAQGIFSYVLLKWKTSCSIKSILSHSPESENTPLNCFLVLFEMGCANGDAMYVICANSGAPYVAVMGRRWVSGWWVSLVLMTLQKQKDRCFGVGNVSVGCEPKSSWLELLVSNTQVHKCQNCKKQKWNS